MNETVFVPAAARFETGRVVAPDMSGEVEYETRRLAELPPSVVTDEGDFEKLVVLVETYFREGGLHLQLNHVTRETLIDAQKHPERYANLRVRVSGFSGCFVKMRKEIQDEIIARMVASVR